MAGGIDIWPLLSKLHRDKSKKIHDFMSDVVKKKEDLRSNVIVRDLV